MRSIGICFRQVGKLLIWLSLSNDEVFVGSGRAFQGLSGRIVVCIRRWEGAILLGIFHSGYVSAYVFLVCSHRSSITQAPQRGLRAMQI